MQGPSTSSGQPQRFDRGFHDAKGFDPRLGTAALGPLPREGSHHPSSPSISEINFNARQCELENQLIHTALHGAVEGFEDEEGASLDDEDSGNTPPPLDTMHDPIAHSTPDASGRGPMESRVPGAVPVSHLPHDPSSRGSRESTAFVDVVASSSSLSSPPPIQATRSPDRGTVERPSSVAALHDQLGLTGVPSVEGIRRAIEALRRRAGILDRGSVDALESGPLPPESGGFPKPSASESGLVGPGHSLVTVTCRERFSHRPTEEAMAKGAPIPSGNGSPDSRGTTALGGGDRSPRQQHYPTSPKKSSSTTSGRRGAAPTTPRKQAKSHSSSSSSSSSRRKEAKPPCLSPSKEKRDKKSSSHRSPREPKDGARRSKGASAARRPPEDSSPKGHGSQSPRSRTPDMARKGGKRSPEAPSQRSPRSPKSSGHGDLVRGDLPRKGRVSPAARDPTRVHGDDQAHNRPTSPREEPKDASAVVQSTKRRLPTPPPDQGRADTPSEDSEAESESSYWSQGGATESGQHSPEHSVPTPDAAAEDLVEPLESDAGKPPYSRVLDNIRSRLNLPVPEPQKVVEAYSSIEIDQGAVPKPATPISLPMAPLLRNSLEKFEGMVAGAGSSLLEKKSKLLLPVPLRSQGRWYEFSDSSMPLTRPIPREFCDLLRTSPITAAGKGTSVSASELLLMESLAMNSLRATSWLDHWLSALGKMVDKTTQPEVMEMLLSGGKSIRYLCQQNSALWAELLLKRRDAALSTPIALSEEERTKLRNSPLLTSDTLFAPEVVAEVKEARKGKRQEAFLDGVASLARSVSRKPSSKQKSANPRPKKKKKLSSSSQAQQQQAQGAAAPADPQPFPGKKTKSPPQNLGSQGKGRGRGRGRGRN